MVLQRPAPGLGSEAYGPQALLPALSRRSFIQRLTFFGGGVVLLGSAACKRSAEEAKPADALAAGRLAPRHVHRAGVRRRGRGQRAHPPARRGSGREGRERARLHRSDAADARAEADEERLPPGPVRAGAPLAQHVQEGLRRGHAGAAGRAARASSRTAARAPARRTSTSCWWCSRWRASWATRPMAATRAGWAGGWWGSTRWARWPWGPPRATTGPSACASAESTDDEARGGRLHHRQRRGRSAHGAGAGPGGLQGGGAGEGRALPAAGLRA